MRAIKVELSLKLVKQEIESWRERNEKEIFLSKEGSTENKKEMVKEWCISYIETQHANKILWMMELICNTVLSLPNTNQIKIKTKYQSKQKLHPLCDKPNALSHICLVCETNA